MLFRHGRGVRFTLEGFRTLGCREIRGLRCRMPVIGRCAAEFAESEASQAQRVQVASS